MAPLDPRSRRHEYIKLLANILALLVLIAFVGVMASRPRPEPKPVAVVLPPPEPLKPEPPKPAPAPEPEPEVAPEPEPAPRVVIDREAVAKAEASVEAARREKARAEERAVAASKALQAAATELAAEQAKARSLGGRVKDPSVRIAQAASRGGFLQSERKRLQGEILALVDAPRPKAKSLVARNAVSKPTDGDEFHFEIQGNRVSYIPLDKLLDLVKSDVRLRMRMGNSEAGFRPIVNTVGPLNGYSLRYEVGTTLPESIADLIDRNSMTISLRGWELIPENPGRGETIEATRQPISDFARAVSRLNPERSTITMWVYPEGFTLYRQLREDLQARGFSVAARPLPAGVTIRGSPSGSLSAAQ